MNLWKAKRLKVGDKIKVINCPSYVPLPNYVCNQNRCIGRILTIKRIDEYFEEGQLDMAILTEEISSCHIDLKDKIELVK